LLNIPTLAPPNYETHGGLIQGKIEREKKREEICTRTNPHREGQERGRDWTRESEL